MVHNDFQINKAKCVLIVFNCCRALARYCWRFPVPGRVMYCRHLYVSLVKMSVHFQGADRHCLHERTSNLWLIFFASLCIYNFLMYPDFSVCLRPKTVCVYFCATISKRLSGVVDNFHRQAWENLCIFRLHSIF